jgi:hypothetical protein
MPWSALVGDLSNSNYFSWRLRAVSKLTKGGGLMGSRNSQKPESQVQKSSVSSSLASLPSDNAKFLDVHDRIMADISLRSDQNLENSWNLLNQTKPLRLSFLSDSLYFAKNQNFQLVRILSFPNFRILVLFSFQTHLPVIVISTSGL